MNSYIQEANQQFVSVYNRYPIILDHGEGMLLTQQNRIRFHESNTNVLPGS